MATQIVTKKSAELNTSGLSVIVAWVKNLFAHRQVTNKLINPARTQMEINKANAQIHLYQGFR
ncbi:MAG: hypothetical protein IH840_17200 [Candidatus Heimdallarchaeota archaeon]|nr:hypothetical protein [Candidatus Heimdallarchaeota archaeon]